VGRWRNSRMGGEGRMVWPDGRMYEGQYENDRKSGVGKFTWPDGRSYYGQWLVGKQHGRGCYTDARGRSWTGDWNEGQKVPSSGTRSDGGSTAASSRAPSRDGSERSASIGRHRGPPSNRVSSVGQSLASLASPRDAFGNFPTKQGELPAFRAGQGAAAHAAPDFRAGPGSASARASVGSSSNRPRNSPGPPLTSVSPRTSAYGGSSYGGPPIGGGVGSLDDIPPLSRREDRQGRDSRSGAAGGGGLPSSREAAIGRGGNNNPGALPTSNRSSIPDTQKK